MLLLFFALLAMGIITNATTIGTPLTKSAKKVMMLGAGELGKEVVIELQRYGVEVIAVDRYYNAPAMHIAHRKHVINMLDGKALKTVIEMEQPDIIVPEVEAIDTQMLIQLEDEGYTVIPTARAAHITMNRERIRRLAAEELHLKTSNYLFAQTQEEYEQAIKKIGIPCVVKPIMSSSGKGQTIVKSSDLVNKAWQYAQTGSRTGQATKVIVEEFIPFDYEITVLTVRHDGQTSFCEPIGHIQIDGDYRESWQPHPMSPELLRESQEIAQKITTALGGVGIFGVELFVKGNEVYFSEVSPRPHDTGMVTLISQDLSEFALHARALLGLPIPSITQFGPAASAALLVEGNSSNISFSNLDTALQQPHTQLRLFGKPEVKGQRRMGVTLARANSLEQARTKAMQILNNIQVNL